jgi:hypothetical protein
VEDYEPLNFDLPDEDVLIVEDTNEMNDKWTLYFDRAVNVSGNRVGAMIISS